MPTFEFTSPEGVKYSVDGPEGATAEQAFAVLQQQLGKPNTEIDPSVPRVDVTGHYVPEPQPAAPPDPSFLSSFPTGHGEIAFLLGMPCVKGPATNRSAASSDSRADKEKPLLRLGPGPSKQSRALATRTPRPTEPRPVASK